LTKVIEDSPFAGFETAWGVVLIDFELSQIIADDCGFKTYTSFRGPPNFVSEARLNLLGFSQKWGASSILNSSYLNRK
jgi:hypothetical protein